MADQQIPLFARQPKSKAVAIRDPSARTIQPIPVVHQPAGTSPALLLPTIQDSRIERTLNPSTSTNAAKASQRKNFGEEAFNVYARPFVPESLMIINKQDGQTMNTLPTKRIHFGAYVGTWVGSNTLQPFPIPIQAPNVSPDSITHTHYELFFRYHLEAEIRSQKEENDLYSLYGHDIRIQPSKTGEADFSFAVPGLRENSPYIEEDDPIQLRQLRYDQAGRLVGMEHWLARGRASGFAAPGWTGIIYNARASVIQRKQEQLVVKVSGLIAQINANIAMPYPPSHDLHLKFNIQFAVPMDRYIPMQQALAIVQGTLRQAKTNLHQYTYAAHALHSITPLRPLESAEQSYRPWLQSMLFPTGEDCEAQTTLNPGSFERKLYDKQLNWEQKKAIDSVCSHNYGTLPFLISGPPGTGKTKTLVEIAVQLVKNDDKVSHILFCAPSDPAADTIIQRISSHFLPTELLRLNRPSRTFAEVPSSVLVYCHIEQDKFDLPPFKQLMSYKIVVTTCRDASLLLYSRMTNSDLYVAENTMSSCIHPFAAQPSKVTLHWTALIMDESAQAIEPEALIPLSVVASPLESTKLAFTPIFVMAGDEHQLGPRTSLRKSPLRTSLFGRLFARSVYADHPLARGKTGTALPALKKAMLPIPRPAFANLIRNYRSHPAILAIPSALFYADTLEPEATDTNRLAGWSEWQGRGWPVLFRNNDSNDDLESDGGGWFNVGEARIACHYAAQLVHTRLVQQNEVCIMSPFKAQVQCLRNTIRESRYGSLWDVDIGPTEAFQGLERGVVILCTTRSREEYVEKDKAIDWGIIGLPNKMNVALTRAKFGLIVIGKQEVLVQDPNWNAFLGFCGRNGLVAGINPDDKPLKATNLPYLTRLEKVLSAEEQGLNESRVIKGIVHHDEMWASGMQPPLDMEGYGFSDEEDDEEEQDDGEEDEEDVAHD